MYRIYTEVNLAETCRDPDDIRYTELGGSDDLNTAIEFAKKYIKQKFIFPERAVLYEHNGSYSATDSGSWPKTIVIEKLKEI